MVTAVYMANYGQFDTARAQPIPVRVFTEASHPLPHLSGSRLQAKWWKVRPDLACPDADVTIWLDASMDILRPDLVDLCLEALGDADAIFVPHPDRDDIAEEAIASMRLAKYAGQPLAEQVASYRAAGHPAHWGLMHGGMIVRRNNDRVLALGEAWWAEITSWSVQDQLSLAPLVATMDLRYLWFEVSPIEFDTRPTLGWVHWGHHAEPDAWL